LDLFGDGLQQRDFTFVNDVVEVLIDGMIRELSHECPVNLAFGKSISLLELIEVIKSFHPSVRVEKGPGRAGDISYSKNSSDLIFQLFPQIKPTSFGEAFEETYNWVKSTYHPTK